jgi:hypothetical protein
MVMMRVRRSDEQRRDVYVLYWPTYSPWLNPLEMRWRQCRREVTHGALFVSLDALLKVAHACFDRYNQRTKRVLAIIGAHAA